MVSRTDTALLVSVLTLLVIVMAAAESGVGPSAAVPGGSPGTRRTTQTGRTTSIGQTTVKSTTTHRTTRTTPSSGGSTNTTSVGGAATGAAALGPSLELVAWYVLVPAAVCLAGGMVALLIRKERPRIFDLKAVVKEMENQRDYFANSLSKRLRNAALLRYYVLMAEACAKLGIADRPADTPHEFIGRASIELRVGAEDAERFAEVVDRAHYGEELSVEEVASASKFMDSFTTVVIGRAGLG
jgi:hypothetical protein